MKIQHQYRVKAVCTAPRSGIINAEAISPAILFSAPPEFQGDPGRWTPEHFLVAGVASCFVSTFSNMAEMSRLEYVSFELSTEGALSRAEDGWRFTEIKLSPTVTLLREDQQERALRLLEKADKSCLISRSLKCGTLLAPVVKIETELLAPDLHVA